MKTHSPLQQTDRAQSTRHRITKTANQPLLGIGKASIKVIFHGAVIAAWLLCIAPLSNSAFADEPAHSAAKAGTTFTSTSHGKTMDQVLTVPRADKSGIDGWALSFDNDALVPGGRDQDYTFGANVTIVGAATGRYWLSLNKPLNWINSAIGFEDSSTRPTNRLFEFGLYGFTPEDISSPTPVASDRPYASIIYVSSIQELQTDSPNTAWRTSLTLGVLGLDIAGQIQEEVHRVIDSDEPKGWEHQISDGGELTARYSIARQILWHSALPGVEIKTTSQASVGYLTEASYSISLRVGNIATRWQSFNPEMTSYGEQSNQSVEEQYKPENYWMLGAAVKARVYNAFLQGQFRRNDFDYNRSELNSGIVEAWAGYSLAFNRGFRLTYLVRGHTSEIKEGLGDRNVIWAGLTLSRKL